MRFFCAFWAIKVVIEVVSQCPLSSLCPLCAAMQRRTRPCQHRKVGKPNLLECLRMQFLAGCLNLDLLLLDHKCIRKRRIRTFSSCFFFS